MIKLFFSFKIFFHFFNVLVIFIYLFPGSIVGWLLYNDLSTQPNITADFKSDIIDISSNHFYTFFILSFLGIVSYLQDKKLNLIIIYLFLISIILELIHIFLPQRTFQYEDLLGNVIAVLSVFLIYKIFNKKKFNEKN